MDVLGWKRRDWSRSASSTYLIPTQFFLTGCSIYLVYFLSSQLHPIAIETCRLAPYMRELNPDNVDLAEGGPWLPRGIRDLLFFWVFRVALCSLWAALLYHSSNKLGTLGSFALSAGGYFVGLAFVEELKWRSGDFECHTSHPNGFSGHAFYSVWAVATLYYYFAHLMLELSRQPKLRWKRGRRMIRSEEFSFSASSPLMIASTDMRTSSFSTDGTSALNHLSGLSQSENADLPSWLWAILALCIITPLCIAIQLIYTYRYGYHSLRQMLLAAWVGALCCSLVHLLSQILFQTLRWPPRCKDE